MSDTLMRRSREEELMYYRLIACDIDGTILRSDGSASRNTVEAIRLAESFGTHVALVTGRRVRATSPVAVELGLPGPHVAHCGAVVFEGSDEKVLLAREIPPASALCLCELAHGLGADVSVYESVFAGRSIFVTTEREMDIAVRTYPWLRGTYRLAGSYKEACASGPVQISLWGYPHVMDEVGRELESSFSGEFSFIDYGIVEAGKRLFDVFAHGVCKSSGLRLIMDRMGIAQREVVAFGDSGNDLDLIEFAGLGVAMGNASEAAKRVADVIAPANDDDGVAFILRQLASDDLLGCAAAECRSCSSI